MAILVDELREYPGTTLPFRSWCHMATDGGFDELHAFAARLGLRRAWFQGDHYDLPFAGIFHTFRASRSSLLQQTEA